MPFIIVIDKDSKVGARVLYHFQSLGVLSAESLEHAEALFKFAKNQNDGILFLLDMGSESVNIAKRIKAERKSYKFNPLILSTSDTEDTELTSIGVKHVGKDLPAIEKETVDYEMRIGVDRGDYRK